MLLIINYPKNFLYEEKRVNSDVCPSIGEHLYLIGQGKRRVLDVIHMPEVKSVKIVCGDIVE